MWHVTRDTWHVTRDTWHVTCDMFGGVNILSKFQLPSSYRLWFMILWRSGGKGSLADWINDEAVYRTAPATPGLLKTLSILSPLLLPGSFWLPEFWIPTQGSLRHPKLNWPYQDFTHRSSRERLMADPVLVKLIVTNFSSSTVFLPFALSSSGARSCYPPPTLRLATGRWPALCF